MRYMNVTFYTAKDAMAKAKVGFSKKTFEFMRDSLHLLPKPIKIADKHGRGTVGYYPSALVDFLKKIEVEHDKGKSYPRLATELKSQSEELINFSMKFQKAYNTEKTAMSVFSKSWMTEIAPDAEIKQSDLVIRLDSGEKVFVNIKSKSDGSGRISLSKWDGKNFTEVDLQNDKQLKKLYAFIRETQAKLADFAEGKG